MPQYIITPWKNHTELLQVRREIYQLGDSALLKDDRRHAVDWIAAWKMRGHLPHAVESTAHLVDAILHHHATKNSAFSIRATYSAAFCRFVTGFCDIGQNAYNRRTMLDVARDLDMPASFVELRHEATHEELPSLQRLTRNAKLALDWLWQYYWVKLDDEAQNAATAKNVEENKQDLPSNEEIRGVLATFLSKRRQEVKSGSNDFSQTSASGTVCVSLIRLCRGKPAALHLLCVILVEEKLLIPAGRTLASPMSGAFLLWDNLLRRLSQHQRHFLPTLFTRLIFLIAQPFHLSLEFDVLREAVYKWICHLYGAKVEQVDFVVTKQGDDQSQSLKRRKSGSTHPPSRTSVPSTPPTLSVRSNPWTHPLKYAASSKTTTMSECIMSPNPWTIKLAQELLQTTNDDAFKEQWEPLVSAVVEDAS